MKSEMKELQELKELINRKYKKSKWQRFEDFVGIFFIACALLLILAVVLFLITVLIENPISLAIICGTILLLYIWRNQK